MKRYEEAIIKVSQLPQLGHIVNEIHYWTSANDDDSFQVGIHLLKEARECLFEWSKEDSFLEDVYQAASNANYDELDLFQKAIYHILSIAPIKDGKFDISSTIIDWNEPLENWQHKAFS